MSLVGVLYTFFTACFQRQKTNCGGFSKNEGLNQHLKIFCHHSPKFFQLIHSAQGPFMREQSHDCLRTRFTKGTNHVASVMERKIFCWWNGKAEPWIDNQQNTLQKRWNQHFFYLYSLSNRSSLEMTEEWWVPTWLVKVKELVLPARTHPKSVLNAIRELCGLICWPWSMTSANTSTYRRILIFPGCQNWLGKMIVRQIIPRQIKGNRVKWEVTRQIITVIHMFLFGKCTGEIIKLVMDWTGELCARKLHQRPLHSDRSEINSDLELASLQ